MSENKSNWKANGAATILIVFGLLWIVSSWLGYGTVWDFVRYREVIEVNGEHYYVHRLDSKNDADFIDGCVGEGARRSDCQCALDAIKGMYPDFYGNTPVLKQILKHGYSDVQMETVYWNCFTYDERLSI